MRQALRISSSSTGRRLKRGRSNQARGGLEGGGREGGRCVGKRARREGGSVGVR